MKDLLIIGGGPGGYAAAIRARQLGMDVTLIEKDAVGGTCLNRGCIPTKAYYRNAMVLRDIAGCSEFNIQVADVSFDMDGARQRKDKIVSNLVSGIEKLLKDNGVVRISGEAVLLDNKTVLVNDEKICASHILLGSGSVPASIPVQGIDLPGVVNSDQLLEISEVPAKLAIIGGGVIGLEFACIFNSFGSAVSVFEYMPYLLNSLDNELGKRMAVFMRKQKIAINTSASVEKIEQEENGLKITAAGKKGPIETHVDMILAAGGRKPFTEGLNLEQMGIQTDKSGFIKVDANYATTAEGIYAIGDVIGGQMLAHLASEEGITAVEKMAGINADVHYHAVPGCIFTFPEIASVGISEEEARKQGIEYKTGKFSFAANGKAVSMGETDGMVKIMADEDDVIIGVHIIGPHASDLIMEGTMMVKNRMKVSEIPGTIHPHPTLGEALMEAALDVHGKAIHLSPPRR